ncbi:MAG: preprotein translocase subunit SecG [Campylobacterales bacterium]|nr:preprotein translocase subunit SecG [Campylobacterales bacterium]
MTSTLLIFQIILSLVITVAVLLQKSSSIGLGAYSGSNESMFGAKGPAGFLAKFTFSVALLFIINTLALGYFYNKENSKSVIDSVTSDVPAAPTTETKAPINDTPAAPTPTKVEENSVPAPVAQTPTTETKVVEETTVPVVEVNTSSTTDTQTTTVESETNTTTEINTTSETNASN